jgi:hypothetical protein
MSLGDMLNLQHLLFISMLNMGMVRSVDHIQVNPIVHLFQNSSQLCHAMTVIVACRNFKKLFLRLQLDLNLERLRMAIEDLLVKLAKMFPKPKLQTVFLINNYDLTIAILKVGTSELVSQLPAISGANVFSVQKHYLHLLCPNLF